MSDKTIIPSTTMRHFHYEIEHSDEHGSLVWIVAAANDPDPDGRTLRSNGYSPVDAGKIGLALALRYAEPASRGLYVAEDHVDASTASMYLTLRKREGGDGLEMSMREARGFIPQSIDIPAAEARALALTILRVLAAAEVRP